MYKKFVAIFLVATAALFGSELDQSNASIHSGFSISGLKIYHQEQWRNMNVYLELDSDEVEYQQIKSHVEDFLQGYDKPADFWEIMNVNLVHSLTQQFPQIKSLKSKIALAPDQSLINPRASTVVYDSRKEVLEESFEFTKLNYLICNETFQHLDLHVSFHMKDNPGRFDYPDYLWLDEAMDEFFKERPISISKWQELKPELEAFLLKRFPTMKTIQIEVKVID